MSLGPARFLPCGARGFFAPVSEWWTTAWATHWSERATRRAGARRSGDWV